MQERECPKCGNTKHQEVIRIEVGGKESRKFRCKACGYTEQEFSELSSRGEKEAIERMGDAFRDYLKKKKK
jgi:predicted nucleic-acid-binding Zn-ribbon protein